MKKQVKTMKNVGSKQDGGKLLWHLVPLDAMKQVILVLMFGAGKYGGFNWKLVENWRTRYFNAAMRHLTSFYDGELLDEETKLPHLAHCVCCCLFLISLSMFKPTPRPGFPNTMTEAELHKYKKDQGICL